MSVPPVFATFLGVHPLLAQALFVFLRAVAIMVPPVQGFAVDLAGIAAFGWLRAFILAEVGIMVGATGAFLIARRWREPLVGRFVSLQKIHQWEKHLTEREAFWMWLLIRLPSNPAFDYISYAAGLTRCRLSVFFWSTLVGSLPSVFLFFVVGGTLAKYGWVIVLSGLGLLSIVGLQIFRSVSRRIDESPNEEKGT